MKLLFDFFPVFLFFIAYKFFGIYVATAIAIAASFAQVAFYWLRYRRFETMHLITLALITILGGATLIFHNILFIKWKPTAINWVFALVFLGSHFIGEKPLIRRLMESNVILPTLVWIRLSFSWVAFFILVGLVNLYVAYNFDTNIWVNFKLFGIMGITIVFILLQAFYMARHIKTDGPETTKPSIGHD